MKKLSPKAHMYIANILMFTAVVYNLVDMVINGLDIKLVPTLVSIAVMAVGIVWRYTLVKCPHCGCKLNESKTIPSKCPNCQETL